MTVDVVAADTALALPDQARALTITTADDYRKVADFLQGIKALRAEVAAGYDEHIKRAFDAHRELVAEKKRRDSAAAEAERIAKDLLVAWDTEQERQRVAEQTRLNALVTEVAIERAIEAADAGDHDTADQVLDTVPTAAVPPRTPQVAGIRFTESWRAEVTDLSALVKAAAGDPQLLALVQANQKALDALARGLKAHMRVPGVRAVSRKDVAAGRRR